MTDKYTFRYLNADKTVNGFTVMHCDSDASAENNAALLMPNSAAHLEIWHDDTLVIGTGKERSENSE